MLEIEIPDYELWLNELWHDFLPEPTPYLVATITCYLGGVLMLVQCYEWMWWLLYLLIQFIPWDENFDLG
jgi:hypothetical protein